MPRPTPSIAPRRSSPPKQTLVTIGSVLGLAYLLNFCGATATIVEAEWGKTVNLAALEAAKVPCGAINTLSEVFVDPQVQARGMVRQWQHPIKADLKLVASPIKLSRTPVREALYRLERDGYLEVMFRSGWQVKPFDFRQFENLYDLRIILELASISRLCVRTEPVPALDDLKTVWLLPVAEREADPREVGAYDEQFHASLVRAAGNSEFARVHGDVTERIRIVRRLDFTRADRIDATYTEHGKILRAVIQRKADQAQLLLRTHIEQSKAEVRKITLHTLHEARSRLPR